MSAHPAPGRQRRRARVVRRLVGGFLVVAALFVYSVVFVGGPLSGTACAAEAGTRTDLRVLLVSGRGDESTLRAWQGELSGQGVPFDTLVVGTRRLTTELLSTLGQGRYQAVVLAGGGLLGSGPDALDAGEQAALAAYEREFGVREVVAFAGATPEVPLDFPPTAVDLSGSVGSVTREGASTFSELIGPVRIEGAQGYPATPRPGQPVRVLVADGAGRALVAAATLPDGRERLVVTVNSAPGLFHAQLLGPGLLRWATRGVHLGLRRAFLSVHVDDVFLPNYRWDPDLDRTGTRTARMTADDVEAAAAWSRGSRLRLDMAFNAYGRRPEVCSALLRHRRDFGWINHTYSHVSFDELQGPAMLGEIERNRDWARAQGLELRGTELVTGAHTGLANPRLPAALARAGIRYIGDDASRFPDPRRLGPAQTVPRFPTNLYYDTATVAEQLDEYNTIYYERCRREGSGGCLPAPAGWDQFVANEAAVILRHVLAGDPRPHYVHQSNLAADRTLYPVLDEVLARYRASVSLPLVQPTLSEAGLELGRRARWAEVVGLGGVTATRRGDSVLLESPVPVEVPLTGWQGGEDYGGERSGWVRLVPGRALVLPLAAGDGQ